MTRHLDSGALKELTLTTNGSQLERFAGDLCAAGRDAGSISRSTRWTRRSLRRSLAGAACPRCMRGIDAAQKAGLRLKINAVALKGFNEDELPRITEWCAERDMDLTWIEVMPMGDIGNENRLGQYWSLDDVRAEYAKSYTVTDLAERTGGPARYVRLEETGQKIGFITPLSHNFCESCNRVRLTCTGELYMCLGQEDMADLRAPLRDTSRHR